MVASATAVTRSWLRRSDSPQSRAAAVSPLSSHRSPSADTSDQGVRSVSRADRSPESWHSRSLPPVTLCGTSRKESLLPSCLCLHLLEQPRPFLRMVLSLSPTALPEG